MNNIISNRWYEVYEQASWVNFNDIVMYDEKNSEQTSIATEIINLHNELEALQKNQKWTDWSVDLSIQAKVGEINKKRGELRALQEWITSNVKNWTWKTEVSTTNTDTPESILDALITNSNRSELNKIANDLKSYSDIQKYVYQQMTYLKELGYNNARSNLKTNQYTWLLVYLQMYGIANGTYKWKVDGIWWGMSRIALGKLFEKDTTSWGAKEKKKGNKFENEDNKIREKSEKRSSKTTTIPAWVTICECEVARSQIELTSDEIRWIAHWIIEHSYKDKGRSLWEYCWNINNFPHRSEVFTSVKEPALYDDQYNKVYKSKSCDNNWVYHYIWVNDINRSTLWDQQYNEIQRLVHLFTPLGEQFIKGQQKKKWEKADFKWINELAPWVVAAFSGDYGGISNIENKKITYSNEIKTYQVTADSLGQYIPAEKEWATIFDRNGSYNPWVNNRRYTHKFTLDLATKYYHEFASYLKNWSQSEKTKFPNGAMLLFGLENKSWYIPSSQTSNCCDQPVVVLNIKEPETWTNFLNDSLWTNVAFSYVDKSTQKYFNN